MKSEHRHELKTNELAAWLSNLPQWANENSKSIIGLLLLIIILAGFYTGKNYYRNVIQANRHQEFTDHLSKLSDVKSQVASASLMGSDNSYVLSQTADELKIYAGTTHNRNMVAFALIKQAEAIRAELQYRIEQPDAAARTEQINKAKACYEEAAEKATIQTLIAAATFGLGLCEEELGNFDLARQTYNDVVTNTEFEGTTAAASAQLRLKLMSQYQTEVVFEPAPQEQVTVTTGEPIQLLPGDSNLPADANLPFSVTVGTGEEANLPIDNAVEEILNITPDGTQDNVPLE